MSEQKPLILIVEDDEDMAYLNTSLLKRQGYETLVAHTTAQARMYIYEKSPDLFVLDIELPDGSGFLLCEEIRKNTDAPVVFLTGKTEVKDKVTGLSIGGDYYLTKPYDRNEFLAVIKSLLRKEEQTKKKIAEVSIIKRESLTLKLHEKKAFINERDAELTLKEFAVLLMLVQNEDKELTSEQLYENVWGTVMNVDTGLIRKTISQIKRKLAIDETDDFMIQTRYGGGYTFISENRL